ncbi:dihydrolipoyl dehydrogenase [Paraliobacillus quinghaiensis]|uniref:Dihydrolipoyl dehydrogenase n=1 Tax=Paraliobacillus quinghaiensis TaxID=470815 RepID=A0A917WQW9_9BACI|nr:dihydrolipoyl dehydrogenase [Paraliobacillus quinghaiensis]GGM22145.1 dihydrolipoyl dehydrogenase [Paraliobacillus quinghaiensis]
MTKNYDLVILGGGTGGYVAAIRASQLGLKTAIVEKNKLGGTCLHKGCIPSKALLRSAEVFRQTKEASKYGIDASAIDLNFVKVQERKQQIVNQLHQGVIDLMKKGQIDVFNGYGRILGPSIFSPSAGTVSVEMNDGSDNEMLISKNVIIATGSKAKILKGLEPDSTHVLTSDDALELESLPKSIIIVGAGVIGVEWASMLADFGVEVTLVEYEKQILPTEDSAIAKEMKRLLTKKGIEILTEASVIPNSVEKANMTNIQVEHNNKRTTLTADKMLVAVGREANTAQIGLENTDIQLDQAGFIKTNMHYQTKESHIYAIGDCVGGLQLAHVASHEGKYAVEHITGQKPLQLNDQSISTCIYANPEIASIGLTEKQAKDQGYKVKSGKVSFKAIGKALVYGEVDGFVKIVSDQNSNDLLGVHMIGPHVTELISEVGLAKVLDATAWEIGETIHPHPSLSEAMAEAALDVNGIKIHG